MIHGMEILKKTEILEKDAKYAVIIFLIFLLLALVFMFATLAVARYQLREYCELGAWTAILFALFCVSCIGMRVVDMNIVNIPTGRYEYEVLISDTSAMKEVYEQYEVVGSKGEIYIIRDREVADNVCSGCNAKIKDDNKFCPECGAKQ